MVVVVVVVKKAEALVKWGCGGGLGKLRGF